MESVVRWLERTMDEYNRIIESASSTSKSIISIKRDMERQNELYANKRILAFSDLFSVLDPAHEKLLNLWYIKNIPIGNLTKTLNISRATAYRKRLEIANTLYQNQHLLRS
jgi:Protein of unknown function (DUF1492)